MTAKGLTTSSAGAQMTVKVVRSETEGWPLKRVRIAVSEPEITLTPNQARRLAHALTEAVARAESER